MGCRIQRGASFVWVLHAGVCVCVISSYSLIAVHCIHPDSVRTTFNRIFLDPPKGDTCPVPGRNRLLYINAEIAKPKLHTETAVENERNSTEHKTIGCPTNACSQAWYIRSIGSIGRT